jgi:hypothetical protein
MLHIRSSAALVLLLGGALSFFASGARLHPHQHHDCDALHIEACHCNCRTATFEQDDRDKNGTLGLLQAFDVAVVSFESPGPRPRKPVTRELPYNGSRDPPYRIRTRAPPSLDT